MSSQQKILDNATVVKVNKRQENIGKLLEIQKFTKIEDTLFILI
jgi:hypothetical protein